jgi:hypothetical protein
MHNAIPLTDKLESEIKVSDAPSSEWSFSFERVCLLCVRTSTAIPLTDKLESEIKVSDAPSSEWSFSFERVCLLCVRTSTAIAYLRGSLALAASRKRR